MNLPGTVTKNFYKIGLILTKGWRSIPPTFFYGDKMNKLENDVYLILKKTAIDIIDDYEGTIASSVRWNLVAPREDGTKNIGLLNLWIAVKKISMSQNRLFEDEVNIDKLTEICNNLISLNLLSEDPLYRREKFKLITNEELNAKREERGPYSGSGDN